MASLRKQKHHAAAMGRTSNHLGGATRCRKHPKHKQSPGVCSLCLREKLSHFVNTGCSASRIAPSASMGSSSSSSVSSVSSYYSSSSASSCSSPYLRPHTARKSWFSMSLLFKRSSCFLTTSRSLASSNRNDDGVRKKKGDWWFWSKLIVNRRGKETMEETLRRSSSTS